MVRKIKFYLKVFDMRSFFVIGCQIKEEVGEMESDFKVMKWVKEVMLKNLLCK